MIRSLQALVVLVGLATCKQTDPKFWNSYRVPGSEFQKDPGYGLKIEEKPGRRPLFLGPNMAIELDIPYGEREIRVLYNGIIAMETVVKSYGESTLFFREVSDGKKLVRLVYKDADNAAECDVSRDRADIQVFMAKFLRKDIHDVMPRGKSHDIDVAEILSRDVAFRSVNSSFVLLKNRVSMRPYRNLIDIESLKRSCIDLHHLLRQMKREESDFLQVMEGDKGRQKRSTDEVHL